MNPEHQTWLEEEIARYERRTLDTMRPPPPDLIAMLDSYEFVHIQGLANFWQDEEESVNFAQHVIDFVVGAHSYRNYFTFVLAGRPNEIGLYLSLDDWNLTQKLLTSAYPGLVSSADPVRNLGTTLKSRAVHTGMISGIPSRKVATETLAGRERYEPQRLERVVRGMRDSSWFYMVQAYSRPQADLLTERQQLLEKIAVMASLTRQQVQQSAQSGRSPTNRQTESVSQTMSGEIVNRRAEYAVELLERELERLEVALAVGGWQVAIYFGAPIEAATRRLGALLASILAGLESRPDPIRTYFCQPGSSENVSSFNTYLTSAEVALLTPLLREESPGYRITDLAPFDVDFVPATGASLNIGNIHWDGDQIDQQYQIKTHDLTRHGVVFGVTGSGKTTTLLHLLHQVWQGRSPVPFLVIEPAKTEYRTLLGRITKGKATGPIPDLRVYTLGNEVIAPFRLNPFEFDLSDTPGHVPVLSHIDFLKAVFNAAFIFYAPMPYVLETALHEIYEDKGWNLATGVNVYLPDEEWEHRHRYPIFPTLTDLYEKIPAVTMRLGYEARIEQDVIAGLQARLGALRLGAKGLMLDTPRGMTMADLLAKPAVLELENIGNDDEKTFLMGMLLARLYGYRRLQAMEGRLPAGLQHVLIVEEAHRLLKHVSTTVDTESSNLRAQAIETFVNMLSEVRHYGQGVLVAEQIPSKLTPDVIKNTNLKIVQRMVAQDDRELLGATMNMNEAQIAQLSTLRPGQAAVYAEGDDHPFLVQIADFKSRHGLTQLPDRALPVFSETYLFLSQYLPVPDFAVYGLRSARFGRPDPVVYQAALRFLHRPDSSRLWARLVARVIFARNTVPEVLDQLRQQIASSPSHLLVSQHAEALIMVILLGTARTLQERGAEKGWSYPAVEGLRILLTAGLVKLARTGDLKVAMAELDRFARAYESQSSQSWGPYPGCYHCRAVCFYRSETSRLLSPIGIGHVKSDLTNKTFTSEDARYHALAKTMRGLGQQWLGSGGAEIADIGFCAALIAVVRLGLDEYEQAEVGRLLANELLA